MIYTKKQLLARTEAEDACLVWQGAKAGHSGTCKPDIFAQTYQEVTND